MPHRTPRPLPVVLALVVTAALLSSCGGGGSSAATTSAPAASTGSSSSAVPFAMPAARHVFVINLENTNYDESFGDGSKAPYLATTLRSKGALLTQYYGTAHNSLPNYIAQISGQGANPDTQDDCGTFVPFVQTGTAAPGQAVGRGCVYPARVTTLADQLTANGFPWKSYQEDMGTPCRHPEVGHGDDTQVARADDQYATRHNPFMYFRTVIDRPDCARRVVDLSALTGDLAQVSSTPNLAYITPDLCSDAHDAPCVDGRPGGLESANTFLEHWVPKILASPAFQQDGVLIVTFDESEGASSDSSACCGEGPAPNAPKPGKDGMGGGRVGAVVVSPWVKPGTVTDTPYNHYGLLRTIEDLFGIREHLGYAASPGVQSFGSDVFTRS